MTQIETIIAEIKRLKQIFVPTVNEEYRGFAEFLLDFITDDIKSLPIQQSKDFKEEFNNFCVHGDIRNPNFDGPFGYDDIRKTAIHFAQWQKEQDINKACEWLKENIYHRVYKCNDCLGFPTAAFLEEFKKAMEDK